MTNRYMRSFLMGYLLPANLFVSFLVFQVFDEVSTESLSFIC